MKLSKLIDNLQKMALVARTDPEIIVWLDDLRLEFDDLTLVSTTEFSTKRGELTPTPEWDEELTLYMIE